MEANEEIAGDLDGNDENYTTMEETRMAIKCMKNWKATVDDNIPAEIVKHMELDEWLNEMFILGWKKEKIPDDWSSAIICPLY